MRYSIYSSNSYSTNLQGHPRSMIFILSQRALCDFLLVINRNLCLIVRPQFLKYAVLKYARVDLYDHNKAMTLIYLKNVWEFLLMINNNLNSLSHRF